MNAGNVQGFILMVESIFEKEFSPEGTAILERNLPEFTQEVFNRVSRDFELTGDRFRPKPTELLALCRKAAHELAPKGGNKQEKVESSSKKQFDIAKGLIGMIISGSFTRGEILAKAKKATEYYPGGNWHDVLHGKGTGDRPESIGHYYERCKMPLDQKPSNYVGVSDIELV